MSKEIRSVIANNILNGTYVKQKRFANFGSVVEDSIMSYQNEWMKRLAILQQAKKDKVVK
jgi:hypothetical protein